MVQSAMTHKIRRFLKILRSIKFEDGNVLTYIRVGYGKKWDVFDKYSEFYNDGDFVNANDLWLAFDAFTEKD